MERKAGSSRRTNQVQGEEFVCITDSMGSCKLGKHIVLEIIEVKCLQWEAILGNTSCQQNSANYMKSMQATEEAGREGGVNV